MVDFNALRKRELRAKQLIGIDFEGQSLLDVTEVGATQYAAHPSTDILCLGFQKQHAPGVAEIWTPDFAEFPEELEDAVRSEEWTFVAHNAQFDWTYWKWMHWQGKLHCPPPQHWLCTAQRASVNGFPRGLDECCAAMGLPGKDKDGRATLMRWCKPFKRGKTTAFTPRKDIPATEQLKIWNYNRTDIDRMWKIIDRTKPVSKEQQLYWQLDYLINQRGFAVDRHRVELMITRLEEAQAELRCRAFDLTGGEPINLNSTDHLHAFCARYGYRMAKMDAHHIRMALADEAAPEAVKSLLAMRQLAALKSSSKYAAFRDRGMAEGDFLIVRDWAVVDGANTGRHTAKGYQAQNMKREICSEEEVESLLNDPLEVTRLLYDEPLRLSGMAVRPMIIARKKEHVLLIGDFARIELCVLLWYACEWKVLRELENGVDLYKRLASLIYAKPEHLITKEERQLGKTGVLGLGYGLGEGGFETQLTEKYGVNIGDGMAGKSVDAYRNELVPNVPRFWRLLGNAIFSAVQNKGTPYKLGSSNLTVIASDEQLVIVLPDGSKLRYQQPYIEGRDVFYWGEDSKTHQWVRIKFWGGAATGHVVQATANRLQRCAAFDLTKADFDIVLHAHDELVCEDVPERAEEFERIMSMRDNKRPWMERMLIKVDVTVNKRYRK